MQALERGVGLGLLYLVNFNHSLPLIGYKTIILFYFHCFL